MEVFVEDIVWRLCVGVLCVKVKVGDGVEGILRSRSVG